MPDTTTAMKPSEPRLTGLKKRQQIEVAGKVMFVWVAIAAVALSFCVATGQYLFTKWEHNNKILGAKYTAANILNSNLTNAKTLKQNVDALLANQDLASVKTNASYTTLKSVLDALPTSFDSAALATSLQQAIISKSGVAIESITVPPDPVDTGTPVVAASLPAEMKFSFVVSGSYDKIRTLVTDLERTIRPMKITSLTLTGSDANLRVSFEVVTYYQSSKTVDLQKEAVK